MIALPAPVRRTLIGCLRIASRDSHAPAGERIAAIEAAERLLAKHGLTLSSLVGGGCMASPEASVAHPPSVPPWRAAVAACIEKRALLTPWEIEFLSNVVRFRRPSAKQLGVLERIVVRLELAEARA